MEQKKFMERVQQSAFFRNNGIVLKAVNLLRDKYVALEDICNALQPSMTELEFRDAVNYLTECGYIRLRDIESKELTTLADASMNTLEAKVTANGMQSLLVPGVTAFSKMLKKNFSNSYSLHRQDTISLNFCFLGILAAVKKKLRK